MIPLKLKIYAGIAAAVLAFAGGYHLRVQWRIQRLEAELANVQNDRDAAKLDLVARQSEVEGWAVAYSQMVASGNSELQKRDSMLSVLGKRLEEANATARQYVNLHAIAEDSLRALATSQDTTGAIPTWWAGAVADGLLAGSWRFERIPQPGLSLNYRVSVPVEIVSSEGGDGRWLITGRSSDPRVRLRLNEVFVDPPEPEVIRRTSRLREGAIAVGSSVLTWLFVR